MRNRRRVSGCLLTILFVSAEIALNTISAFQLSSTVSTSAQTSNLTWTQMKTQNPLDPIHQCTNCSKSDNDDLNQYQQQKRRKRRRNRGKPRGRIEQFASRDHHQLKKHSTRVRLDQPTQFWSAPQTHDNILVPDATQPTIRAPPPARHLLPPYLNIKANETAIAVPQTKANSKFKTLPTYRGSTKFKNTIHDEDYRENEIDTAKKYDAVSEGQPVTHVFKPIVVQPTPSYVGLPDEGATTQIHLLDDRGEFVSAGVAAAGMQVISMSGVAFRAGQPTTANSRYTTTEFIQLRDPQLEKSQHSISETNDGLQRSFHEVGSSVAGLGAQNHHLASELNSEVDVLPPIQFTYGWDENPFGFNETSQSTVFDGLSNSSSRLNGDTREYKEVKLSRIEEDYERPNNQSQPLHILPASEVSSAEQNNDYILQRTNVHGSVTTTPVLQPASTPITHARANRKQSSGKGLDLAETQNSSGLLSEQQVSSLFQNENQKIPGAAGKDYPIFGQSLLQKRRFACRGLEGYFADTSARCQVFYICNGNGAGEPMLCPNGTLFSQDLLVCDWWYNVDC